MPLDEKAERALRILDVQTRAYVKTLPKKKKRSILKRLLKLTRMAALAGRHKSEWQRQYERRMGRRPIETVRTKAIVGALESALTEEEIKRLRGIK